MDDIKAGLRVESRDYGKGTVVAVLGHGIQLYWDKPLAGTTKTHLMVCDRAYVMELERLPAE